MLINARDALADTVASGEFQHNYQFAEQPKLKAFPSWVIGKGLVPADIDYVTPKAAIMKTRAEMH